MTLQRKKDEIQRAAVEAWLPFKAGRLQMCTGSGKSRAALLCALAVEAKKLLIIVPTENLRDNNWPKELEQWAPGLNADFVCYASISKIKNQRYDFVIFDEIHRLTELSSSFISQNSFTHYVGLTATDPQDPEKLALINAFCPAVFNYSLEQGVEDGVVAPFDLIVLRHFLDDTKLNIKAGSKTKPFYTTEYKQYKYLQYAYNKAYEEGQLTLANTIARRRMDFLYNLPSKTEAAKKLVPIILPGRALIFCGSINQAEQICEHSYHSQNAKLNNLEKLKLGEINHLSCIKKLNEGENIDNLDDCLIVQANSKELDLIQRLGRVVRWRPNHRASCYIMVTQNTQDEVWVNQAKENFSSVVYKDVKTLL